MRIRLLLLALLYTQAVYAQFTNVDGAIKRKIQFYAGYENYELQNSYFFNERVNNSLLRLGLHSEKWDDFLKKESDLSLGFAQDLATCLVLK